MRIQLSSLELYATQHRMQKQAICDVILTFSLHLPHTTLICVYLDVASCKRPERHDDKRTSQRLELLRACGNFIYDSVCCNVSFHVDIWEGAWAQLLLDS